jgi:hypothetical protein
LFNFFSPSFFSAGQPMVRHVIHFISISFHVADAIRERMKYIFLSNADDNRGGDNADTSPVMYLNYWEFEDILYDFNKAIADPQKEGSPTRTIFILNLDIPDEKKKNQLLKYKYR